jgi:tape measure domain-containing protein
MAQQENLSIVVSLVDNATKELQKMRKSFDETFSSTVSASKKATLGVAALAASLGVAANAVLNTAGKFEQTQVAFRTLVGDVELADALLKELGKTAASTPFGIEQIEDYSKRLLAYNVGVGELIPTLEMLGDIAAGVGVDKMPQLILAFGQVRAATRLTGAELRQFTEAGIPLLDALSQSMGKSIGEIQSLVTEGGVSFEAVQAALQGLTSEGGRFYNLMENQSKTLLGLWSNFKDQLTLIGREIGGPLLEAVKPALEQIVTLTARFAEYIKGIDIAKLMKDNIGAIIAFSGAMLGMMIPAIVAAVSAVGSLLYTLSPFIALGALVAFTAYQLAKAFDISFSDIVGYANVLWENMKNIWSYVMNVIDDVVSWLESQALPKVMNFFNGIVTLAKIMWDAYGFIFKQLLETTFSVLSSIWEIVKNGVNIILNIMDGFGNLMSGNWAGLWTNIKNIVGNAWNAIVEIVAGGLNAVLSPINALIGKVNDVTGKEFGKLEVNLDSLKVKFDESSRLAAGSVGVNFGKITDSAAGTGKSLSELIKQLGGSGGTGDSLSGASNGAGKDIEDLTKKINSLEDSFKDAQTDISKSLEDLSIDTSKAMAAIEKDISDVNAEMSKLKQNYRDAVSDQNKSLAETVVETENTISDLQSSIAEQEKIISDERAKGAGVANEEKISDAELTLAELQAKLSEEQLAYAENAAIISSISAEIEEARRVAGLTTLQKAIENYQREREQLEANFKAEMSMLSSKKAGYEKNKQDIQQISEQLFIELKALQDKATTDHLAFLDNRSKADTAYYEKTKKELEDLISLYKQVNNLSGASEKSTYGKSQYFSEGGEVKPLYLAGGGAFKPKFTDTVPAMLTPGERVLSVEQNKQFERGMGGTTIVNNFYDTNVLSSDDVIEKLGNPIIRAVKDHMALV